MKTFIIIIFVVLENFIKGQDTSFQSCLCNAGQPNQNDPCAWITPGCPNYNIAKNTFCCIDQQNCYNVTDVNVRIGGFKGGRCLTPSNSTFLCNNFPLLQVNLNNWNIVINSGDVSNIASTNAICQIQNIQSPDNCIGYTSLQSSSLNSQSGYSKVCIQNENSNSNKNAVTCQSIYCKSQKLNQSCIDSSKTQSIYSQYGIIGVDSNRNCLYNTANLGQVVPSSNSCFQASISQVCFQISDNTCWDLSTINTLDSSKPIGIFQDGSCAFVNILQNKQIQNCTTQGINVCIYNNTNINSGLQGCAQWKNVTSLANLFQAQPIVNKFIFIFKNLFYQLKRGFIKIKVVLSQILTILIVYKIATVSYQIFTCVFLNAYTNKKVLSCNQQINNICLENSNSNNQTCYDWQLPAIQSMSPTVPIVIFQFYLYNLLFSNLKQIKLFYSNFQKTQGIFKDYSCAYVNSLQNKQILNCKTQNLNLCIYNNTNFSNGLQGCAQWKNITSLDNLFQAQPIGIYQDQSCAFLNTYYTNSIQYCNSQLSDICIDNSQNNNQACIQWNYNPASLPKPSNNVAGIFQDHTCVFLNTYTNKIVQSCNQQMNNICLENSNSNNQTCYDWQLSTIQNLNPTVPIGIFKDYSCAYVNSLQNKQILNCRTQNLNLCIYNNTYFSNGLQGCAQWKNITSLSNLFQAQPIGIYQDLSCAFLNTYYTNSIQNCNSQLTDICIDNSQNNNQACIQWNYNPASLPKPSNNVVGIFQDQSCVFLNAYTNKKVLSCNQQIDNICLENFNSNNQTCYDWQLSTIQNLNPTVPIGIFKDYSCAYVNSLQNKQILNCRTQNLNLCIYNNTYFSNGLQGCAQWKNITSLSNLFQAQPIGIYQDLSCAFLNNYYTNSIQNCNSQLTDICIDNSQNNNQACIQWNYNPASLPKPSNVVGIFLDQTCVFLNAYTNKKVLSCNQQINNICLENSNSNNQTCYDWQLSTIQNLNPTVPIGIFTDYTCAFLYTYSSKQMMLWNNLQNVCIDSRNINNEACSLWDNSDLYQKNNTTPIGKFIDGSCSYLNIYRNQSIQYCNQMLNFICLDNTYNDNQGCAQWNQQPSLIMNNHILIGIFNGGNCAILNTYNNTFIKSCNFQIDFICQDIRNVASEACLNFSIAQNQIVGENSNHICLIEGQPSAIKCSKSYCIDTDQSCKILDGINRFMTQRGTYQCLQNLSETDVSDAIWCAVNYCRLRRKDGTYYCIKIDRVYGCKDDQTHDCLRYNDISNTLIVELAYNFCYQRINNFYKCINADLDQILVIKDNYNQCQAFTTDQISMCYQDSSKCQSTIQAIYCGYSVTCQQPQTQCVIGPLCLNNSQNCVHLDYSQTFDFPGRMIQTSNCQPLNSFQNELCSKDYCLLSQQCLLMTQDLYVSQEKGTSKCLQVQETGDQGARFCIQGFCKQVSKLNLDFCIKMTDQISDDDSGFIATDKDGYCISIKNSKNNPNIYSCLMNIFCLDNTNSCIQIDPTTTCVDSNFKCAPIDQNQCMYCHIKQCLFYKQCITIPQQNCLGFNGKCILAVQNGINQICKSCATSYCYDSKKLNCLSYLSMNTDQNQCLLTPEGDSKCKVVSLNEFNYCADQYGQCQSLSSNPNSHCLRCPKTYVWVGNFTCFSSQMIEQMAQKSDQQENTIFSLSLIYKQLDLSQTNQTCGQGCQKCLNNTSCLQCSFEYYLFDDQLSKKQYCNLLPYLEKTIQYPDSLFEDKDYISQINDPTLIIKYNLQDYYLDSNYQMSQVYSTCIINWQLVKDGDIVKCDTFNVQYLYISQIVQNPLLSRSYRISMDSNRQIIFSEILIACTDPFCNSCQKTSNGQEQCLSCKSKYALNYSYQCMACPSNCTSCFYGGYYNQKTINWSQLISSQSIGNIDFSKLSFSEYQLLCQQCEPLYVVTKDYSGCEKCGNKCLQCYQDNNQKYIYQCTNCKSYDPTVALFPSYFGCSKCPEGCSSCYESQIYDENMKQVELKNRTNQIIYEQIRPSLQEKLNSLKQNDFEIVCSSCQDGYYLLNKLCVKNKCGNYCDLCFMKNYNPICISCSYDQLSKQIQAINTYILSFYQQTSISLRYLTHFTSDKKDCYLCPIGCSSCEYNSIDANPYKIYDAKCYSCKEVRKLGIANINPNITQNYEWRWNQETKSCSLCLKNQTSCVYRKETNLFVTCKSITDTLGSGTLPDPLNLQRASDAQWDSLILNQTEFKKALVYMNELGVREILVNVYILDKNCVLGESTSITTNLLQLIPKLQILQINIIGNQTQDSKNPFLSTKINLYNQLSINGFLNVQFQNIDFQQPSNIINKQIITINNTDTISFQFNNCTINGTLNSYYDVQNPQKNNSKLLQGFNQNDIMNIQKLFFNIIVYNLRSSIEITNSRISNVILYQQNLFSFQSTQKSSQNKLMSLNISNFTTSQSYFQQSSIISLQYLNLTMAINNTEIRDNLIIQNSLLFMINQTNLTSQCSNSVSYLKIIRNKIYSNSQIFVLTNLIYNIFENTLFDGNIIQNQKRYNGLIVTNQMVCSELVVINNFLSQVYIFLNFYDNFMDRQVYMKDSFYLFIFDHATINNNYISLYESSVFYYFSNSKQFDNIKLSNIQISSQNQQDKNLKSSLFTIYTCFKALVNNFNITNINQVTLVQAQNLNYYVVRNININNSQTQSSLLNNILFSIQQIFVSIDIILFNGQNIFSSYPIIYILNGFNLAESKSSAINLKQINFSNTTVFVQQQFIVTSIITIKTTVAQQISLINSNFQNNNALLGQSLIITDQFESCSCLCIDAEQSQILLQYSNFTNNYSNSTRNTVSAKSVQMLVDQCSFANQMQIRTNYSITYGGFIYSNAFVLKLQSCFLYSGFAMQGGAIYFKGYHDSQFTLDQTQIFYCRTALAEPSSLGGAIFIQTQFVKNLNILFQESSISNNLATISGGAFYIEPFEGNVFFEMRNSIMQNNFALQGAFLDFSFVGDGLGRQNIYLFPSLFNIKSNKEYNEYNNNYNNFTCYDNLISLNSNFLQISNSQFIGFQCNLCNLSTFYFIAEQFLIQKSAFVMNIGSDQGGMLLIKQQISNIYSSSRLLLSYQDYLNTIKDCTFTQNQAFNGGAITIQFYNDFSTNIQECKFIQNQALNKGGAIFYQQLSNNNQVSLNLINNLFSYNVASIGAILYTNIKQYLNPIKKLNSAESNVATKFGSSQISSPNSMIAYYNQNYYQNNSVITVQSSGKLQYDLTVLIQDDQGQQFKELGESQSLLKAQQIYQNNNTFIQDTNIPFENGIFNLTKYLKIFGKVNEILSIKLTLDDIRNGMIQNYSFVINFRFNSTCQVGNYMAKTQNNFDLCTPCSNNSFSLIPNSTQCNMCPKVDGFICYSNILLIPNGYWKINQSSPQFFECTNSKQNCIGDTKSNQKIRMRLDALKKDQKQPQSYYCNEGYIGSLCQDCDILGQYWIQKYYKVQQYQCQSCNDQMYKLSYQWIYLVSVIGINIYLIYTSQKSFENHLFKKISKQLKNRDTKISKADFTETYILMKLIINYFQILAQILQINPRFLNVDFTYLRFITNPLYEILSQFDCLISDSFQQYFDQKIDYQFFRIFLSQILIIVMYLLTIVFYLIIFKYKLPSHIYLRNCINAIIIVIVINISGVSTLIFESLLCTQVGEYYYVQKYSRITCDDMYYQHVFTYCLPLLIMWALLIPLLYKILRSYQYKLHYFKIKCSFGFLYNQYKYKYFYWELINICQKIIIALAITLTDNQGIQFGLSFSTILSYKLLVQKFRPNLQYKFNDLEKKVNICLGFSAIVIYVFNDEINQFYTSLASIAFILINSKIFIDFLMNLSSSFWQQQIQKIQQNILQQKTVNKILLFIVKKKLKIKTLWSKLVAQIYYLEQKKQTILIQKEQQDNNYNDIFQDDSLNLKQFYKKQNQLVFKNQNIWSQDIQIKLQKGFKMINNIQKLNNTDPRESTLLKFENRDKQQSTNI
ncbi:hypothetical protein ABPG73_014167 [Tetrahymena malaccensis]